MPLCLCRSGRLGGRRPPPRLRRPVFTHSPSPLTSRDHLDGAPPSLASTPIFTPHVHTPAHTSPHLPTHRLFVKLLGDYLNEIAYPAELAGLGYGVHNSQAGFQVRNLV